MDEKLKPLFTPWRIGNCEIKNRIVLTSMGGTDLFGWMEKNHFDKMGARFLREAAKNNAGLVLPGCQPVYNPMFGQWLYKNKKMYEDLKEWMPEFHKTGAKLFVQLTAGFGRSFTISEMMENYIRIRRCAFYQSRLWIWIRLLRRQARLRTAGRIKFLQER